MRLLLLGLTLLHAHEICYNYNECNLGCFTDQPPWGGTEARPNQRLPDPPSVVAPVFHLDTRKEKNAIVDYGDFDSILSSTYDGTKHTYFIVHGFMDSGEEGWLERFSDLILSTQNVNVIRVDWRESSRQIDYTQAATDTQLVGRSIRCLIESIVTLTETEPQTISCIGHSLGAQTCGYLGESVQELYGTSIPRIYGLDPAEPYFKGVPPEVCLEITDADFVSIIHSDATQFLDGGLQGLGVGYPIGHMDFWPNNGTDHPGCDQGLIDQIGNNDGDRWEGIRDFVACNHLRAVRYFEESLTQSCAFKSYTCESYAEFESGYCLATWEDGIIPEMGFYSDRFQSYQPLPEYNNLYLKTSERKPFCAHSYKARVHISQADRNLEVTLYVRLQSDYATSDEINVSGDTFEPKEGMIERFGLESSVYIGTPNMIEVTLKGHRNGVGKHYATVSRIDLFNGEDQTERSYQFYSSTKMEVDKSYILQLIP